MKIVNLCFADNAGAAFTLSHALNKQKDVQAISLRANNNYIDYPTIAELRYYSEESCRKMVYEADVVVFHTAVVPFYTGFHLDPNQLKHAKKLLYFHGSDCRSFGKQILAQADEKMGAYEVLVSTPDLLKIVPQAVWMPVARSFSEIHTRYGICGQDHRALEAFGGAITKTVLGHAPTSTERKGSALFFRIITELIQQFPNVEYQVIQNLTWDACLRALSHVSIFYDQHLIGSYGLAAVEAAIFKAAVFCRLNPDSIDVYEKESGIHNPFIQWANDDDIRTQSFMIVQDARLQRKFGQMAYNYCKAVHDEGPVAARFLKVVAGMDA